MKKASCILFLLLMMAMGLQANGITLVNPSFEDNGAVNASGQSWQDYDIVGWLDTTASVINENRGSVTQTPYGTEWAHLQGTGTSIGQAIGGTSLIGVPLEVSFIVTRRTNEGLATDTKVQIVAGTASSYVGGVVLAEKIYNTPLAAAATYNEAAVKLTPTGDPGSNDTLWLVLANNISGNAQLHIDNVAVTRLRAGQAINVAPADGAVGVDYGNVNLQWQKGADPNGVIQGYYVYLGKDGSVDNVVNGAYTTDVQYPVTLDAETGYQWRVDTYLGGSSSDANNIIKGEVWSFETKLLTPQINSQPQNGQAIEGSNVIFQVGASDPLGGELTYQWWADPNTSISGDEYALSGPKYDGVDTDTLVIKGVSDSDEMVYFCKLTNAKATIETDHVSLTVAIPIAHYEFEGNANDSSVYGNNGTWVGTEAYVPGALGQAASFDGSSWITLGTSGAPNATLGGVGIGSVSFWLNTTSHAPGVISGTFNDGGNLGFQIQLNSGGVGRVRLYIRRQGGGNNIADAFTNAGLLDGKWHHVVITWKLNQSSLRAYVDGQQQSIVHGGWGNINNIVPWQHDMLIGARQNRANVDSPLTAALDDYRVYNYQMSKMDVFSLYTQVVGAACFARPQFDISGPDGVPDCVVNLYDFAEFASQWLSCGLYPATSCP